MEAKGAINQYMPHATGRLRPNPRGPGMYLERAAQPPGKPVFTINLAAGTTPFVRHFDGREYASQFYRLTAVPVVTHANYRPTREEFDALDEWSQDHVLNGGLLCAPLDEAIRKQLPGDRRGPETEYEQFQAWCLEYYGRRRPPLEAPQKGK